VLLSVVLHGSGIAIWLRRDARASNEEGRTKSEEAHPKESLARQSPSPEPDATPITIDELRARLDRGERVTIVDARSERTWEQDDRMARGAIRLPPNDAVRAAKELGLDQHGSLVVYCA
jgi:hypothetical protein